MSSARLGAPVVPGPTMPRRSFRTDVQGLRAVAVGLVLVYHAGIPFITGGYVGVDVFFVISGFLISSHLLESLERHGRIRFADFYARRIRRILPASLVVALLTAVACILFYPPLALERVLRDGLATILYVPNIRFADQNTDYLADHAASPYQHYWSLGVEEQFYLLWPLVLLSLFFIVRRRRALVIAGIAGIATVSLVAGVLLTASDQPSAFFLLPTRAWELLIGGLVGAVLLRGALQVPRWIDAVGGWLGVGLILTAALVYDDKTAFPGTAAILPTAGAALVILFGARAVAAGPGRLLSFRPMQFIGLISYSLYLVHWPLLIVTQAAVGEDEPLRLSTKVGLGIVLAVPLAWLLYRFVETPLRAPGRLVARRPRVTLWGTLGITVVLVAAMFIAVQWSATRDVGTGDPVAVAPEFPAEPPEATPFVPRNMTPVLDDVDADLPVLYADDCQHNVKEETVQTCRYGDVDGALTVAVFGDSLSAQWFPAIADFAEKHEGVRIDAFTKSSCPAVEVTVIDKDVPYASCDRWREKVLQTLEADPPDLVVTSSYAGYSLVEATTRAAKDAAWSAGLASTIQRLNDAGSRVLVVADTPRFLGAPATCASAHVLDVLECAGDRTTVLDEAFATGQRRTAEDAGATYADLTPYICDSDICPVVIDDMFVYRDVNHLTSTFVHYLAPALDPIIASLLGIRSADAP